MLAMLVSVLPAQAARGIPYLWIEAEDAGAVVSGQFKAAAIGGGCVATDQNRRKLSEHSPVYRFVEGGNIH